jgi:serine/threonine protein kinase
MHQDLAGPYGIDTIAALFPAFDIEGLIAEGAAGTVYKARQRSLDREVAIRIAPRARAADPAFRNSFRSTAKSMASLGHPGLIRVYDSGEVDNLPFVVMEYVPGKSLHHSSHGKAVHPRQAVQIVIAACEGLAHAHGKGIAHGAIRPTNILLTQKCEPKIGNFGFIAQDGIDADAAAYRAPELSSEGGAATPQADVFAFGVILKELLTGIPAGNLNTVPVTIPDAKLAAICQKATHPDPAQRYPDAGTLAIALGQPLVSRAPAALQVQRPSVPHRPKAPVTSKPPSVSYPASRAGRSMVVHCTIIAALLFAIHGVWGAYQDKQESLARLRKLEEAKPGVIIVNAESGKASSHGIAPELVQLKP